MRTDYRIYRGGNAFWVFHYNAICPFNAFGPYNHDSYRGLLTTFMGHSFPDVYRLHVASIDNANLILLNSIKTNYREILITNGIIDIEKKETIKLFGKFSSKFDLKRDKIIDLFPRLESDFFNNNTINTKGTALHEFDLKLSNTLEILDYNYAVNGKIDEAKILLKNNFKPKILEEAINKIYVEKTC